MSWKCSVYACSVSFLPQNHHPRRTPPETVLSDPPSPRRKRIWDYIRFLAIVISTFWQRQSRAEFWLLHFSLIYGTILRKKCRRCRDRSPQWISPIHRIHFWKTAAPVRQRMPAIPALTIKPHPRPRTTDLPLTCCTALPVTVPAHTAAISESVIPGSDIASGTTNLNGSHCGIDFTFPKNRNEPYAWLVFVLYSVLW